MKDKNILYTPKFLRNLKKIPSREYQQVQKREKLFKQDPFTPQLKTHKLKGKLSDYWSFSVTRSYRIVFRFLEENKVLFVDVGTHDIYK